MFFDILHFQSSVHCDISHIECNIPNREFSASHNKCSTNFSNSHLRSFNNTWYLIFISFDICCPTSLDISSVRLSSESDNSYIECCLFDMSHIKFYAIFNMSHIKFSELSHLWYIPSPKSLFQCFLNLIFLVYSDILIWCSVHSDIAYLQCFIHMISLIYSRHISSHVLLVLTPFFSAV